MQTNPSQKTKWEEYTVPRPVRLAALWASLMSCYIYGDYFSLYIPGEVEGFIKGRTLLDSPGKLLAAAVLLAVPALMIFLSVGLKASYSRRLNIVLGIFYTLVMLVVGGTSISTWRLFYVFLALVEIMVSILIVVYAMQWPRQKHLMVL